MIFMVIGASLSYISCVYLIEFSTIVNKSNYAELVEAVLGQTVGKFLHYMFIFYSFGCNVTYQIVIIKFFPKILEIFGVDSTTANSFETRCIYMGIINVLLYPVVYVKDITALAYFNSLGLCSAIYVLIVLSIQMPDYLNVYWDFDKVVWYKIGLQTLQGYSISVFAYTFVTNIFVVKL